ncbi:hypothetical protein [Microbulbifer sediminum]|nr:hypothetical protein [Microbulbifer sediminum]
MLELTLEEQVEVNGGFVCGGLCVGAAAFAAGALFGAGLVIGYKSEAK